MVNVPEIISIPADVGEYGPADIGSRAYSRYILASLSLPTPPAFVITTAAFYRFLEYENCVAQWRHIIENAHAFSPDEMVSASQTLQKIILHQKFSPELSKVIFQAYDRTLQNKWAHLTISPTPTTPAPVNLPLPVVKGESAFLDFLRQLWSSQTTPHALALSLTNNSQRLFCPSPVLVSVFEPAVASGTVTTIDPLTKDKHLIRVEAIWGTNPQPQSEPIQGDIYLVDKQHQSIVTRTRTNQDTYITTDRFGHYHTQPVSSVQRAKQKLEDDQILSLIQSAQRVHDYSMHPQIINWLMVKNTILFTRFTPFDPESIQKPIIPRTNHIKMPMVIATGLAAAPGIVTAPLLRPAAHHTSLSNRIAVFPTGDPQLIQRARTAAGIIIESGGLTSELAIVARETGIPTLIGTGKINVRDDIVITLDATHNQILQPSTPTDSITIPRHQDVLSTVHNDDVITATHIYITVSQIDPQQAYAYTQTTGVGICRGSDIFSTTNIHPKQLLKSNWSKGESLLTASLQDICQTLGERPVYYLPYDLDTASASHLEHGDVYEPVQEQNPLIGFRGAYRIIKDPSVFEGELRVIRTLRHKYGIKNLSLILPLVRSVDEIEPMMKLVSDAELYPSPSFQIWIEIGTPAAIDLIPYIKQTGIQGIILNGDLLMMLIQGFDPNSAEVDQNLSLTHQSLLPILKSFVTEANRHKLPIILAANQLDQSADTIEAILRCGFSSITVSPPRFQAVQSWVSQAENKFAVSQNSVKGE